MKTRVITALATAAVAAVLLAGCSGGDSSNEPAAGPSGTLRVNWGGFPTSWAPGGSMEPGYMRVPYENLVVLGDDGVTIEPNLATSWEQTDTSLTLKLRDDVTFHDGTAFDAEAVKANIEYVRDNPGQFAGPYKVITSIDVVDDHTVTFNLSGPAPSMLTTLTGRGGPMASPTSLADGSVVTTPVGTGPWAYDPAQSIDGTKMTFTLFEDYWGEMPGFANVELYGIADNTAATAALLGGEIDITDTEADQLPTLEAPGNVQVIEYPAIRNNITFLDRGPGGMFEDVNVRKAICYATDTEGHYNASDNIMEFGEQHFLEGEYGYDPDINGYPFDAAAAKKAFTAAGSPNLSSATFPVAAFLKFQIEYFVDSINKTLGTEVKTQELAVPQFQAEWNSGKYAIALANNAQVTPYDWYSAWFAQNAGSNPAHVESAALKAAAAKAIAAGTTPEAEGLWQDVMKIIIDDEALACAFSVGSEILAINTDTVSGAAQPTETWEQNLINYRDLKPVAAS